MLLGPALAVSAVLFTIGVAGVLIRRNAIVIFMCVELMLNAVNLTFVALAQRLGVSGQIFVFFVMAVAAAEAAVGLAIILAIYRHRAPRRARRVHVLGLDPRRHAARARRPAARPAVGGDAAGGDGGGVADSRVQRRLHGRRRWLRALLRLPEPVRVLHAHAGAGRELPGDVRRLGRGGAVLVFADRLLVQRKDQRRRGEEGVPRESHRGRRVPDRDVPDLPASRGPRLQ